MSIIYFERAGSGKSGSILVPLHKDGTRATEGVDYSDLLLARDEHNLGGWKTDKRELKGKPELLVLKKNYHKHSPYRSFELMDISGSVLWKYSGYISDLPAKPECWDVIKGGFEADTVEKLEAKWNTHAKLEFI